MKLLNGKCANTFCKTTFTLFILAWNILLISGCSPTQESSPLPTDNPVNTSAVSELSTKEPTITPTEVEPNTSVFTDMDGMDLIFIPEGKFLMIENKDTNGILPLFLDAYWIDKYEVTNSMFVRFLNDNSSNVTIEPPKVSFQNYNFMAAVINDQEVFFTCADENCLNNSKYKYQIIWNGSNFEVLPGYENHPIVRVKWNGAQAYCNWAGRRLPTEAEWEKAATWDEKSQEKYQYPWGNTYSGTEANFCDKNCPVDWADKNVDDGFAEAAPVGSFQEGASSYGVMDLAGNVWEMVADWYIENYWNTTILESYINPKGPDSVSQGSHVVRGGSWRHSVDDFHFRNVDSLSQETGFRCAKSEIE